MCILFVKLGWIQFNLIFTVYAPFSYRTTPGGTQLYSEKDDQVPPPKSAPPGSKPRCERFYDIEHRAGRKILEPHLKVRRSPRTSGDEPEVRMFRIVSFPKIVVSFVEDL